MRITISDYGTPSAGTRFSVAIKTPSGEIIKEGDGTEDIEFEITQPILAVQFGTRYVGVPKAKVDSETARIRGENLKGQPVPRRTSL